MEFSTPRASASACRRSASTAASSTLADRSTIPNNRAVLAAVVSATAVDAVTACAFGATDAVFGIAIPLVAFGADTFDVVASVGEATGAACTTSRTENVAVADGIAVATSAVVAAGIANTTAADAGAAGSADSNDDLGDAGGSAVTVNTSVTAAVAAAAVAVTAAAADVSDIAAGVDVVAAASAASVSTNDDSSDASPFISTTSSPASSLSSSPQSISSAVRLTAFRCAMKGVFISSKM